VELGKGEGGGESAMFFQYSKGMEGRVIPCQGRKEKESPCRLRGERGVIAKLPEKKRDRSFVSLKKEYLQRHPAMGRFPQGTHPLAARKNAYGEIVFPMKRKGGPVVNKGGKRYNSRNIFSLGRNLKDRSRERRFA